MDEGVKRSLEYREASHNILNKARISAHLGWFEAIDFRLQNMKKIGGNTTDMPVVTIIACSAPYMHKRKIQSNKKVLLAWRFHGTHHALACVLVPVFAYNNENPPQEAKMPM